MIAINLKDFPNSEKMYSLMSFLKRIGYDSHINGDREAVEFYAPYGVVVEALEIIGMEIEVEL